eukprot:superscaffoldBa00001625_g11347
MPYGNDGSAAQGLTSRSSNLCCSGFGKPLPPDVRSQTSGGEDSISDVQGPAAQTIAPNLVAPCPKHFRTAPRSCCWLQLRAANGLEIPYVGYVELDVTVFGKAVPQRVQQAPPLWQQALQHCHHAQSHATQAKTGLAQVREDEHLSCLDLVLGSFRKEGLKAKLEKCHFLQQQVSYLGHVVSAAGVSTDPKKITAVADWANPGTVSELRPKPAMTSPDTEECDPCVVVRCVTRPQDPRPVRVQTPPEVDPVLHSAISMAASPEASTCTSSYTAP